MGTFTWTLVCIFLFMNPALVFSNVQVTGPDEIFTGDFEKFTCEMDGDEVTENTGLTWKFRLKNDDVVGLNDSDTISVLEVRKYTPRKDQKLASLSLTSFIRVENPEVKSIICENTPKTSDFKNLEVKDLPILTADNDPCTKAESKGKPVISMFIPSTDLISPTYPRSHYIDDQYVPLAYGIDITEVKLVCYSPSNETPKWSLNRDLADKMKYAAWAEKPKKDPSCKRQIIHIYQVAGLAGQVTNIALDCSTAGGSKSTANLGFAFNPGRSSGIDFNSTQNCIDNVVQQFYDKELTGVGITSSLVIILMMAGMAVLKRQLNQQQNINRDLQGKNPAANTGNTGGNSSTEQLNPNNQNTTNNV